MERSRSQSRASRVLGPLALASFVAASAIGDVAHASGPVERLVQVLLHPSDPNVIVVRWGLASEGYLFSRDRGQTFSALCSAAITASAGSSDTITRLSGKAVAGLGATLVDHRGNVVLAQNGSLFSADGTGCAWSEDPALTGYWPYSLVRDPQKPDELLAVVNLSNGDASNLEARARLLRRDASGTWTSWDEAGSLVPHVATQRAYGSELVVTSTEAGTRMYASVAVSSGPLTSGDRQKQHIVSSVDGGRTWSEGFILADEIAENFVLLAVDPTQPRRVLGAQVTDNAADTLWLSEDEGKTFTNYGEIRSVTAVTFAPDGRLYISDAGDSTTGEDAIGGLWSAARLGEPLSKLPGIDSLDCLAWSDAENALYACVRDKFGIYDPRAGSFRQLTRLSEVGTLLSCGNLDVGATCEDQLNSGPAWCCTGHYPFTPFCGDYDVTMFEGRRVFCGQAGRRYDEMNGLGPKKDAGADASTDDAGAVDPEEDAGEIDAGVQDAGARDAGRRDGSAAPASGGDDGCAIGVHRERPGRDGGALVSLGLLLIVLGRSLRRARPR